LKDEGFCILTSRADAKRTCGRPRRFIVFSLGERRSSGHGPAHQPYYARGKVPGCFQEVSRRRLRVEAWIFQAGELVFAFFLRDQLAADFQDKAEEFGRAAMALAYNVRCQERSQSADRASRSSRREAFKAGERSVMGRIFRILRRSRRVCLGDCLESALAIGSGRDSVT
jgi:hypothetical protein